MKLFGYKTSRNQLIFILITLSIYSQCSISTRLDDVIALVFTYVLAGAAYGTVLA